MSEKRPRLSIGIIFKDDVRSLERCLKALEPLRKAVPCELVMADTGSTDGSREIAQRYADLLFDFPWVNDFSAARNAVMDRCSGVWYLTVDSDEYLDPDISELTQYVTAPDKKCRPFGYVIVRNYRTREMRPDDCSDFSALRLVRMDTGSRYEGAIHERLVKTAGATAISLKHTIFHHDGYATDDMSQSVSKLERNLALLRQELAKHPDDPVRLLQCIESSLYHAEERKEYIRKAVELVKKAPEGDNVSRFVYTTLYRYSARDCLNRNLPNAEAWLAWGEEHMADTLSFRVDVGYTAAFYYYRKEMYSTALAWAERYEAGCSDYDNGRYNAQELSVSPLQSGLYGSRASIRLIRCDCLLRLNCQEEAVGLLEQMDPQRMAQESMALQQWYLRLLPLVTEFPERAQAMCARALAPLWEPDRADVPEERKKAKQEQKKACILLADQLFRDGGWEVFLQTPGDLGVAARSMSAWEPAAVTTVLAETKQWLQMPTTALVHAIRCGAALPESFYRQDERTLRTIAASLGKENDLLSSLPRWAYSQALDTSLPRLQFLFQLLAAALRSADWEAGTGVEEGCDLFSKVCVQYIPMLYHPDVLAWEDNWIVLPGLHRFALYLSRANTALAQGRMLEYVRDLKAALSTAPAMKHMVEYLLKKLDEKRRQSASPELRDLADKVRTILAQYPPDDPAVVALKQSEVYQKVAYLIEGTEAPVFGGIPQ